MLAGGARERIDGRGARRGPRPDDVTLVVVTKEVGLDAVRAAIAAGAVDLGENRAQELVAEGAALRREVRRAPRCAGTSSAACSATRCESLAPHVALWQSVDRAELAAEIGRRAPGARGARAGQRGG